MVTKAKGSDDCRDNGSYNVVSVGVGIGVSVKFGVSVNVSIGGVDLFPFH